MLKVKVTLRDQSKKMNNIYLVPALSSNVIVTSLSKNVHPKDHNLMLNVNLVEMFTLVSKLVIVQGHTYNAKRLCNALTNKGLHIYPLGN